MNKIFHKVFGSRFRPTSLRIMIRLVRNMPSLGRQFGVDMFRFIKYSSFFNETRSAENMRAVITALYHGIEKGLSLPSPRVRFGAANIDKLLTASEAYVDRFGVCPTIQTVKAVLASYRQFHINRDIADYPHAGRIDRFLNSAGMATSGGGGTRLLNREDIINITKTTTDSFFYSRHSVRQFSDRPVDASDILMAQRIAEKSPAVCNRMFSSSIIVDKRETINELLELQAGAKGFSDFPILLVITNSLTSFFSAEERHQCWVDGGLYAMSLIYGLHARGLGTCALNWSKSNEKSAALRAILKIPADREIIMLLAVGHMPDQLEVAYSSRDR